MIDQDIMRGGFTFSAFWFAYITAVLCNHYLQPRAFAFLVWCLLSGAGFWLLKLAIF